MKIENVQVLGSPTIGRREALRGLGIMAADLLGLPILGAGSNDVGLKGQFNDDTPFRSIGGVLDKETLILPSGQSVIVAQYGNPILAPAAFHAASLQSLSSGLVDLASLKKALNVPDTISPGDRLAALRVYNIFLKDGAGYREIDLSQALENPPTILIAENGNVQIKIGDNFVVKASDSYFVKALYHADHGRIDPNAVIAICEQGSPPSFDNPIIVSELGTPLIASAESLADWKDSVSLDSSARNICLAGEDINGTIFIRKGNNLWRYNYTHGSGLSVDCRPHLGLEDKDWDKMGDPNFYQLRQERGITIINPEPHRKNLVELSNFHPQSKELFGTGLVLSIKDGQIVTQRTSLSKLVASGAQVRIDENNIIIKSKDSEDVYRLIEFRLKTGFASNTVDVIGVNCKDSGGILPKSPVLTSPGSYDFLKAYKQTQELIASS